LALARTAVEKRSVEAGRGIPKSSIKRRNPKAKTPY